MKVGTIIVGAEGDLARRDLGQAFARIYNRDVASGLIFKNADAG